MLAYSYISTHNDIVTQYTSEISVPACNKSAESELKLRPVTAGKFSIPADAKTKKNENLINY